MPALKLAAMTTLAAPQPIAAATPAAPAQPQLAQALSQLLSQIIGQALTGTVIALLNDTAMRVQTPAGLLDLGTQNTAAARHAGCDLGSGHNGAAADHRHTGCRRIRRTGGRNKPAVQIRTRPRRTAPVPPHRFQHRRRRRIPQWEMDLRRVSPSLPLIRPRPRKRPRLPAAPPLMQAALSAATAIVRDAVATQGSLTTLYANLEAVVTAPAPLLPAPVLDAAKATPGNAVRQRIRRRRRRHQGRIDAIRSHRRPASKHRRDAGGRDLPISARR